jgi:hypothetical protein
VLEIGRGFRMAVRARKRRLQDAYAFPGFRPEATVRGVFGDPKARIIKLKRRSKKRCVALAEPNTTAGTTARSVACATFRAATHGYIWNSMCDAFSAGVVAK